jgi:hypothetical protein
LSAITAAELLTESPYAYARTQLGEPREAKTVAARVISVTPAQVAAAKLRLVTDAKLGKKTPAVIKKIAEARPDDASRSGEH